VIHLPVRVVSGDLTRAKHAARVAANVHLPPAGGAEAPGRYLLAMLATPRPPAGANRRVAQLRLRSRPRRAGNRGRE